MTTKNARARMTTSRSSAQRRCSVTVGNIISECGGVDMSARATTTATISMSGMSKIRIPETLALHCGARTAPT
jgi:hypothetical protein